jgi:parvulin-like peptidyl-prolyl isomerase
MLFCLKKDYRKEIMRSKKPKKKLETIAYQYSDCPTASKGKIILFMLKALITYLFIIKGGDLGYFKRGEMLSPFEESAFGLEVGELSQPVWTDSGIHIILRTA